MLRQDPVVSYILDTKTEEIGPGIYRFKAEVWRGRGVERCFKKQGGGSTIDRPLNMDLRLL